jgi:hypothetical protein
MKKNSIKVLCSGCSGPINPGEGVEHNRWHYHRRCLDKYLSKHAADLDKQIGKTIAEIEELKGAERPDDGSDGQHYDLIIMSDHDGPQRVRCVEVVEALDLKHGVGEAFCAIWRMGKKPGEERARALRKAIYYLQRELRRDQAIRRGDKK